MKTRWPLRASVLALLVFAIAGCAGVNRDPLARTPDVIYVPTPQNMVEAMLTMAEVKPGEMVYDLGCGDGRIVITAARDYGARGIGVDIDPRRVEESLENVRLAGVGDRVEIRRADLFQMDFSDADVVALYLLPALNLKLRPKLLNEVRPGTRIVSNSFDMGDWPPDQQAEDPNTGQAIYFWRVPAKLDGEWTVSLPDGRSATLALTQKFQRVEGTLSMEGRTAPLRDVELSGKRLTFSFGERDERYSVTAEWADGRLTGVAQRAGRSEEVRWTAQPAVPARKA